MFILCQGINSVDKLQKILFQRVYIFTRLVLGAQKKNLKRTKLTTNLTETNDH